MIYDNGYKMLGKVKDLIKYTYENCGEEDLMYEIINDLELYDNEDIVVIDYESNGMGYRLDVFRKGDIVNE